MVSTTFCHCRNNFDEALKGYTFKSVSEIVSASPPPRIVRVLDAGAHSSPSKTPVESGELLLVRKTGKTMLRKPFIKVYNFVSKEEKTLYVRGVELTDNDPLKGKTVSVERTTQLVQITFTVEFLPASFHHDDDSMSPW